MCNDEMPKRTGGLLLINRSKRQSPKLMGHAAHLVLVERPEMGMLRPDGRAAEKWPPLSLATRGREAFPSFQVAAICVSGATGRHGGGGAGAPMSTRTPWRPIIHFVGWAPGETRMAMANGHHHHHTSRHEEFELRAHGQGLADMHGRGGTAEPNRAAALPFAGRPTDGCWLLPITTRCPYGSLQAQDPFMLDACGNLSRI